MQDILKALDALSDEELEVLIARAEALLRERIKKSPLREDPAVSMWKDREDMEVSAAWVREVRQREWRERA
jgi:hypothetical protein